jgi:hypothetical protein
VPISLQFGILERDAFRHRQSRRLADQFAEVERAAGSLMDYRTVLGAAGRHIHLPDLGSGRHEQGARCGSGPAQRLEERTHRG